MCLAVPGKIISLGSDAQATIDMMGATRDVSVRLTPDAAVGDYVLVHAGFAIQVIDAQEAAETIKLFQELDELALDDLQDSEASTAHDVTRAVPAPMEPVVR